jgi:hypothetical protein
MDSKETNEVSQQEAMEVDGDGDQVELKKDSETSMNGDEKVNEDEKGPEKSGTFKVKVSGLPRFYPLGVSETHKYRCKKGMGTTQSKLIRI